jgi:protein SCO1/2
MRPEPRDSAQLWLAAGLAAGLLNLTSGCRNEPELYGAVLEPPTEAAGIRLSDQHGHEFDLADHRGKVVLIYFGFTNCPDVCPITLGTLKAALNQLDEAERDRVVVAMVTVDPDRDTPEALAEYLAAFDPGFLGLSGSQEELDAVYDGYGIEVKRQALPDSALEYTIDHTASLLVIDADGKLREMILHGTPADLIAQDIAALMDGS